MGLWAFLTGTPDSIREWEAKREEREEEQSDWRAATIEGWNQRHAWGVHVREENAYVAAIIEEQKEARQQQVIEDIHRIRTLAEEAAEREEVEYQARLAILFGRKSVDV